MESKSAEYRQQSAKSREQSAIYDQQIAEYDQQIAEYDKQISEYDKQISEYDKQISEYRQQSAEAIKNIMHVDSVRIKQHMQEFYDIYTRSPNIIKQEELDFMKKTAKEIIASCEKYGINYKDILLKET